MIAHGIQNMETLTVDELRHLIDKGDQFIFEQETILEMVRLGLCTRLAVQKISKQTEKNITYQKRIDALQSNI